MDITIELKQLRTSIGCYYVLDAEPERPLDQNYPFIRFFSRPEREVIRDFLKGPVLKGVRLTYMNMTPVKEPFEATLRLIEELA